jgi:hypothetical protein
MLMAAVAACSGAAGHDGRLSASWKGSAKTSGTLKTTATANWCAAGHLLEIMGIAGDSGIAVLLYPADGVKSGSFAVIDPLHEPVHTGAAAVAARWPDGEQIVGYRGVKGTATLKVDAGTISGSITSTMLRPGAQPDSVSFDATFSALQADSGIGACPPDSGGKRMHPDSVPAPRQDSAR